MHPDWGIWGLVSEMDGFAKLIASIESLAVDTAIPKPRSLNSTKISHWGTRRGERALIYSMPNHSCPEKKHQKGVTVSELHRAYENLVTTGEFNRAWFSSCMPACMKEGTCNFTTIGGLFELTGIAEYCGPGVYRLK